MKKSKRIIHSGLWAGKDMSNDKFYSCGAKYVDGPLGVDGSGTGWNPANPELYGRPCPRCWPKHRAHSGTLSKNKIFNKVVNHLYRQGEQSKPENSPGGANCLYRGPRGLKCAVGCLIPDDKYNPKFDQGVTGFFASGEGQTKEIAKAIGVGPKNYLLLSYLQSVHDSSQYWFDGKPARRMKERLIEIATELGITKLPKVLR